LGNRATELLLQIQKKAIERAQSALFLPMSAAFGALLLPLVLGILGALLGMLIVGATILAAMFRIQGEIAGVVGEVAGVYTIIGRVVEFRAPEWRVIGAE